jgi:hypothetical protein
MRVLSFKPQFENPIQAGTKLTTYRGRSRASKRPKGPPKIGEKLSLRKWIGRPYGKGSTHQEFARALCQQTFAARIEADDTPDGLRIALDGHWQLSPEITARYDGFATCAEMRSFFEKQGSLPFEGYCIRFSLIPLDAA